MLKPVILVPPVVHMLSPTLQEGKQFLPFYLLSPAISYLQSPLYCSFRHVDFSKQLLALLGAYA